MLNSFRGFGELVFFDLWIPDCGNRILDSGIRIVDSGFWFPVPDLGFRLRNPESGLVLGLPLYTWCSCRGGITWNCSYIKVKKDENCIFKKKLSWDLMLENN